MNDYSHLPEWIQREVEDIERDARSLRAARMIIGGGLFGLVVLGTFLASWWLSWAD